MNMEDDFQNPPRLGRWTSLINSLVAGLSKHLNETVTIVDAGEMPDGFSSSIRGPEPCHPSLQVAWEGTLGMQNIDGKPHVSATLFLFSRGRRLRLDDQTGSFLEIVYEGPLDGTGTWRDLGWLQDDFGEFEEYDRYGN